MAPLICSLVVGAEQPFFLKDTFEKLVLSVRQKVVHAQQNWQANQLHALIIVCKEVLFNCATFSHKVGLMCVHKSSLVTYLFMTQDLFWCCIHLLTDALWGILQKFTEAIRKAPEKK